MLNCSDYLRNNYTLGQGYIFHILSAASRIHFIYPYHLIKFSTSGQTGKKFNLCYKEKGAYMKYPVHLNLGKLNLF